MNKNLYFIFFGILFFLFNCNSKESIKLNENFTETYHLTEWDTIINDDRIKFAAKTVIHDSLIVIREVKGKHHFLFVSLKNKDIIKKWAIKGRGPSEYNSITSYTVKDGQLYFVDRTKKTTNSVSIKDVLLKDTLEVISKPYPYIGEFRPRRFFQHKNKKLALGSFQKGRVGLLDDENNILGTFGEYPFQNEGNRDIKNLYKGAVYQGDISLHPKKQ